MIEFTTLHVLVILHIYCFVDGPTIFQTKKSVQFFCTLVLVTSR